MHYIKKYIWVILVIFVLLFLFIANSSNEEVVLEEQLKEKEVEEPIIQEENKKIKVDIKGAVNNPGVYEGEANLRLYQFIELAGGFREDASVESLNLAQEVQDGIQIYVPSKQEAAESSVPISEGQPAKLNLNTASKSELTQLLGIGEVKAEAILSYRDTNGAFQTIEELMNIPGIKEATFEQIKDLITVMN